MQKLLLEHGQILSWEMNYRLREEKGIKWVQSKPEAELTSYGSGVLTCAAA